MNIRVWLAMGLLWCGAGLCAGAGSDKVELGDTVGQVVAILGPPQGTFKVGHVMTYYYERGMIDFRDGVVVRADVLSLEQVRQRRRENEQAEKEAARQAALERERLIAKGRAELERALGDPQLATRSPEARLAFWEAFSNNYPNTDISRQLTEAKAAAETAKQNQENVALLASLQKRLGEIQARLEQLDADYAASLANWKRNEIDAERAKLNDERQSLMSRLTEMLGGGTAETQAP